MTTLGQTLAVSLLVLGVCAPAGLLCQSRVTITGAVADSAGAPISGAIVFLDQGIESTTTNSMGNFRLDAPISGTHLLNYRKSGFAPRSFNVEVPFGQERWQVGVIMLRAGPDPTTALGGTVHEATGNQALEGVVIELNGKVVATTDSLGQFTVTDIPVQWGANELRVRYAFVGDIQVTDAFWVSSPGETFEFSVLLDVAPLDLPGIRVEALPPIPERLRDFYARRADGRGVFFTREEIEAKNARRMSDLFVGISYNRVGSTFSPNAQCRSSLVYMDGLLVGGGASRVNINELAAPDQIEAMEVYIGIARVPLRFSGPGSDCGVVVLWTR